MELQPFWQEYIDGYLLSDLASMEGYHLDGNRQSGALGYPMAMTVLAGTELLGLLTYSVSESRIDRDGGLKYFSGFWREWMYLGDPNRGRLADAVYALLRNGIAHSFLAKPRLKVTRLVNGAEFHLRREPGTETLVVDADVLAADFRRACSAVRARRVSDAAFESMVEKRYRLFAAKIMRQGDDERKAVRKAPEASQALPPQRVNTAGFQTDVSSPAANLSVTTINVGSKPFSG